MDDHYLQLATAEKSGQRSSRISVGIQPGGAIPVEMETSSNRVAAARVVTWPLRDVKPASYYKGGACLGTSTAPWRHEARPARKRQVSRNQVAGPRNFVADLRTNHRSGGLQENAHRC